MKYYICNCVNPNLKELECNNLNEFSDLIDNAEEISLEEFDANCENENLILVDEHSILDFTFYKNGDIYFFEHSMIEYFFK